jgi:hypothetical protein
MSDDSTPEREDGDLTPEELTRRLFAYFDTEPLAKLVNI